MTGTSDHIERLAELYLTQGDPPHSDSQPRAILECVVVGHLPVRAGLWLTQYADDVAREAGATGLIRIDSDQTVLEVLRGAESAARVSGATSLREAVDTIAGDIRRWIVRVPADDPTRALALAPDVVTILSGADEAAVVAAYRIAKNLFDAALANDREPPSIELAILGADRAAAEDAAEKISATSTIHLGIDIPLARCVRAMGALGHTLHFRFGVDEALPLPQLAARIRSARPAEARSEGEAATPAAAESADPVPAERSPAEAIASRLETPGFGFTPTEQPRAPERNKEAPSAAPGAHAPAEQTARLRPKPSVEVEPKRVTPDRPARHAPEPRALATWVRGLAKLGVTCPDAREVEIAVDASGELHVLGWDDRIRDLHIARRWVMKHAELISMACPDHSIRPDGAVACHIFTSEPASVSDLHDTELRLHVLAPVEVEGRTGWYAAALNA